MDTGFKSPTTTGAKVNLWTNPSNAYSSDNTWASRTGDAGGVRYQSYETFGFSIPSGSTINGIEVQIEGQGNGNVNMLEDVYNTSSLAAFTTQLHFTTHPLGAPDAPLSGYDNTTSTGGASDLWNTTWTVSDFSDTNFSVRVGSDTNGNVYYVDQIQVKVYYTAPVSSTGSGLLLGR